MSLDARDVVRLCCQPRARHKLSRLGREVLEELVDWHGCRVDWRPLDDRIDVHATLTRRSHYTAHDHPVVVAHLLRHMGQPAPVVDRPPRADAWRTPFAMRDFLRLCGANERLSYLGLLTQYALRKWYRCVNVYLNVELDRVEVSQVSGGRGVFAARSHPVVVRELCRNLDRPAEPIGRPPASDAWRTRWARRDAAGRDRSAAVASALAGLSHDVVDMVLESAYRQTMHDQVARQQLAHLQVGVAVRLIVVFGWRWRTRLGDLERMVDTHPRDDLEVRATAIRCHARTNLF